jgi:hypothetical protein
MIARRGALPFLLVAVVLAWGEARPAVARSHSERSQAREAREVERLREQGAAALTSKDFAAAERAYTELYRRTLQPEGLYRLGLVAQAAGRRLEAQDLMRRFVSDPRFDPTESAAEAAEARRILALPPLPSGKLSVIGERGTLVFIDGRLVGALPLARPLLCAPGKRKLTLEDGSRHQEEELDLAVGRSVEITYDRGSAALLSAELSAVLVLEQYAGLAPATTAALAQVAEDVLQNDRLSPFPLQLALERTERALPSSCLESADCLIKLARQSDLDYVLKLSLTQPPAGGPGQLRLLLLDAEVGEPAAHSEAECPAADGDRVTSVLRSELAHLLAAARARPRGELKVTSQPAGAEVRLGRRLLGKTPLEQLTWAGPLEVEVALPGYESQRLPVTLPAGQAAALAVTLQLDAAEPAPAPLLAPESADRYARLPRPRWRLAVGGAALAGGVLLGGFGAAALALSGQCVVEPLPPAELCRERYGTGPLGAGLLSSGVAALVAGTLLLAIPLPYRRPAVLTTPVQSRK